MENIGKHHHTLNDFLEEAELQQYSDLFRDVLKITKLSQLKFVVSEDLDQIGLSRPEQRRYKKIFSKYFPNPYISKIRKLLSSNKKHEPYYQGHTSIPMDIQPFQDNNVKGPTKHIICIEDITINKELGKGQFGVVQQGTWSTGTQRLQVAIKCLGQERMTSNSTEFLKEAAVMHSIEHPSIVRLYGVVLHSDSLMLVTELAPLRSLLECLRETALRADFGVQNLCEFAEQICLGMLYLEHKRLIHRDLAARNILVFSKDRVKISDFGLSRALGVGKDYYQTNYNVNLKLPVAWCAPECILFLRFTSASDVWAFAVCLWEMFTYGFQPWAGFSGQQILEAIDTPNLQRLECPPCCPQAYYSMMLECWSQEPNNRPKFSELTVRLRDIRPPQVQALSSCHQPEDSRRNNFLDFRAGQIITVLAKENLGHLPLWYGVLPGGACGLFDPTHTKPYVPPGKCITPASSISPHPTRHSSRSIRSSLLRCDVKRHTYTGKRTIQRSMISSPQGDVKHTGHVGVDGAYFGDISFLDPTGCPPRQIVTPYKPSEDLEQVPLINPNSPSHLTGASCTTAYPMLTSNNNPDKFEGEEPPGTITGKLKSFILPEVDYIGESAMELPISHIKPGDRKNMRKTGQRSMSESTSGGRSILSKVKYATLGRSYRPETAAVFKTEDVHEYHEISDNDTLETTSVKTPSRSDGLQPSSSADFSQSLLDEMESLFRNLDTRKRDELSTSSSKNSEGSTIKSKFFFWRKFKSYKREESKYAFWKSKKKEKKVKRAQTMLKSERKRSSPTNTMKLMSAHDEKTLNTAVALANEITSKSMNDLGTEKPKYPHSPNDRSKFHFKIPLYLHHHGHHCHEPERDKDITGKQERRNFSEEAKSVPDIQSTLTAESKMAYTSLIEEPTPSTSLMSHLAKDSTGLLKPVAIPKPVPQSSQSSYLQVTSLQKSLQAIHRPATRSDDFQQYADNPLPLPPRTTKPKLIDKPRHIRKYPLKIPGEKKQTIEPCEPPLIIYQNTSNPHRREHKVSAHPTEVKDVDVHDGPEPSKVDTNPFTSGPDPSAPGPSGSDLVMPGPSGANPFTSYTFDDMDDIDIVLEADSDDSEEGEDKACALVKDCKDHVSVEDLLEFADQKPCGRQRGVESDEVRIMSKVFKQQVSPEECLEALELSDWNVHNAIKLVRVSVSVGTEVSLEDCSSELTKANGDITKASAVLVLCKQKT